MNEQYLTSFSVAATAPHRRRNALTGAWVLVSPQRDQRPWQGQTEVAAAASSNSYEPGCYLCPGNSRASGERNPDYTGPYVFRNDFPALTTAAEARAADDPLFGADSVVGECRVLCYSPAHDQGLATLPVGDIRSVVDVWALQLEELQPRYRWVQIFENRGAAMGCSNHHPHGQIWASEQLPTEPAREDREQTVYHRHHGRPLLLDYAQREQALGERTVAANADWLCVVPWWATWPFETLLLPLRPAERLTDLAGGQRDSLAAILRQLLAGYDELFGCPFPYSMGWHGAPGRSPAPHWQLHAHFFPPLLRSATVRKFMVGYEMLAEPQRDMTPETAASRLRDALA